MNKYIIWLATEYKRAACRLPLAVKRAVISAIGIFAIAGLIAFCTSKIIGGSDTEITMLKVGYVADDDMITNLAISYVENMKSVKSICSLERIEKESEGMERLKNGELSALVVLPENVIGEIVSGTNAHGKLYLPEKNTAVDTGSGLSNVAVMLFEEIEKAGVGMLSIAQAEIYAVSALLGEVPNLDSIYDDIDRFNLSQVAQREKLFSYKSLSLTGNDTYAVYYTSALLTIYLMLAGLFFGEFAKRSQTEQLFAKRRIGVGYACQLICRYISGMIIAVTIVMAIAIVITAVVVAGIYFCPISGIVSINLSREGILAVLMATIFMTIFNMLVFELSENRQAAVVMTGFNTLIQAYMSGCIVPSVLLPDKISQIGEYLPAAYIKKAFRIFITGRKDELETVAGGLFIWCFIIFVLTLVCIKIKENIQPKNERKNKFKERKKYHIPSLPMVVLRRFVHKKSIWICLIIITAVSVMIVTTEKSSATNIYVAFYDESGEYVQTLEDYEGLVRFVSYGSEDEVRLAVLRDEVECGYIIPQKLTESMILQMSNGMVTVYQDDDAVAVPIVNEVIFEKLFKNVSLKWYENYICKINTDIADMIDSAFEEKLNAGVVFDIDINYMGNKAQTYSGSDEAKATYPVQAAAILIVAICGIYGIIQVVSDAGKKRFYRCKKISIYLLTILIPILFGAITGILIIAIIANIGQYSY